MDLFDFFFPEQAQASHLRRIAEKPATGGKNAQPGEVASLRRDVNFLTLVLATILKRLDETQTLSIGDVQDLLAELDGLDGIADSGLSPRSLRELLGAIEVQEHEPANEINIVTTPRYRKLME